MHCALCNTLCTMRCTVHCALCNTLCTVQCTVVHCALCNAIYWLLHWKPLNSDQFTNICREKLLHAGYHTQLSITSLESCHKKVAASQQAILLWTPPLIAPPSGWDNMWPAPPKYLFQHWVNFMSTPNPPLPKKVLTPPVIKRRCSENMFFKTGGCHARMYSFQATRWSNSEIEWENLQRASSQQQFNQHLRVDNSIQS